MARVEVRAVLAGTVTAVQANAGQHVTDGDPIVVVESM